MGQTLADDGYQYNCALRGCNHRMWPPAHTVACASWNAEQAAREAGKPTADETIRLAIEKLEQQRAVATSGPWIVDSEEPNIVLRPDKPGGWDGLMVVQARGSEIPGTAEYADTSLIVTLHRTIDAQLAILRNGAHRARTRAVSVEAELDLARAILG